MNILHKFTHSLIHSFTHLLLILLIISQLAVMSCSSLVTEIDPSILPHTDSKLVVACFISPQDTVLSAKVTETKTVIGSTGDIKSDITTATVKLSDGTKTINLAYNAADGYYRALPSALPIIVGKTYTINVSSTDGRSVNANTTVPKNVAIKEVKLDSAQTVGRRNNIQREFTVKMIFNDQIGEVNYYRGIGVFIESSTQTNYQTLVDFRTLDDKTTDGELLSLSGTFRTNSTVSQISRIKAQLLNTDSNYYNYQTSLRKQRDNNNPFAEPTLLYTNINGGFGCFGSYSSTVQIVK